MADSKRIRVAVLHDFIEEGWLSMDLVGEMLIDRLVANHSDFGEAIKVQPRMIRRASRIPAPIGAKSTFNVDRLINRFWDYPRFLRGMRDGPNLFHLVDHSYSQLVHVLPAAQTVVTCHDLDTFRCLLDPVAEPRPWWFRAMTSRILSGFRKAAKVLCDSKATQQDILRYELLPPHRLEVIHNGVHPVYSANAEPGADLDAQQVLGPTRQEEIEILHVGNAIRRKRIDILLRVFAHLRQEFPAARLIQVGGDFTPAQIELARELRIAEEIVIVPRISRSTLAAVYRRAALVMLPSDAEGFGLPLVEALACGTPVLASDLPVLREVGNSTVTYCAVGDVGTWVQAATNLLNERTKAPERWKERRRAGICHARKFSWDEYARRVVAVYRKLLSA